MSGRVVWSDGETELIERRLGRLTVTGDGEGVSVAASALRAMVAALDAGGAGEPKPDDKCQTCGETRDTHDHDADGQPVGHAFAYGAARSGSMTYETLRRALCAIEVCILEHNGEGSARRELLGSIHDDLAQVMNEADVAPIRAMVGAVADEIAKREGDSPTPPPSAVLVEACRALTNATLRFRGDARAVATWHVPDRYMKAIFAALAAHDSAHEARS